MLEPPDSHFLRAAEGWLELGNCVEAKAELSRISSRMRCLPEVLDLECKICSAAKDWKTLVNISATLIAMQPTEVEWYIRHGNALFFMGRTDEAREFVTPLIPRFPENAILQYNLACYECQLGHFEEAKTLLVKSFGLNKNLRDYARQDPDLSPFWQHFPNL